MNFDLKQVGVFRRNKKHKEAIEDPIEDEQDDYDASEFEDDEKEVSVKVKNRRPREDNFTQQRIKAFNPIITPKTVIPLYLFIAVIFIIVGGVALGVSSRINELTLYYQDCVTAAPSDGTWSDMPSDHYISDFKNNKTVSVSPQWRFVDDTTDDADERGTCQIRFNVPYRIPKPVYINYLIENFYPNHRRYVLSFSEDQLRGKAASYEDVHDNTGINCKPLVRNEEGKIYYPCGIIANSMFNDTFPFELINVDDTSSNYTLINTGINWRTDRKRFKKTKYTAADIAPPPYWEKQYPDGYNDTNIPDVQTWEEFQNWMRPAAFQKFAKLIRRNENDTLEVGTYQIDIGLHWPVTEFKGKKAVYITHGSPIGGKNPFLGIIYLIGGLICVAMAIIVFVFWIFFGRKVADPNALSWKKKSNLIS
ncbi:hypothetical protein TPHA_0A00330 [Tetrapisispora phaffii CBS 4417]|uniref:Uncharacterized protein n=1 Tax=Tetrapisispora phaffii (strain ATCC 24235 / CBS 4417 / NBRC 1672 / NRRL Y-8282 / UCD 70-5) TaxID=1071381 RepID=G8BMJ0_TETPH|nr:hypothetical protein TPHA_0A00330 [Tetrapisispora phaffii CBS 4417]CCE61118.1 hypothetical protein TPHA_0A00330 [Tetrapisispora phaffii CBS 4417]